MTLLYPKEHFNCFNYEKGKNASLEILKVDKGGLIERDLFTTEIVFVISGNFILNYGKVIDLEVTRGKILFFPPGSHVHAEVMEDTHIIICRIRGIVQLCECVSLEHIFSNTEKSIAKNDFHMLNINDKLEKFIDFLIECSEEGLKCSYYFETKMKELFFLLRAYYSKEELKAFFTPLLSHNSTFMNLMYKNYRNVKNVKGLAEVSLYSESGFKKQFQKVFGTSASDWLRNQKASLIFHDLNCSEMSIKELADKYDFSSVSSFTTFCQNVFNKTPGQIRNKKQQ
ncbi:AraC family transcriptional regulator [Bacteroides sp. 519]|uniref:AraC family transcriptional regulator n=1 Tax=Bacteroides sp. 519 TaxID=2302937 RepID=UPI0013D4A056|nr:AraC family transcriptional regulator [Bacteroides sp. 519]NDV60426.1 AraC family transcriptional regulator [Bacteroides sp. 519]